MAESMRVTVKRGISQASDEQQAVAEFCAAIAQPDTVGTIFFCSSKYDLKRLGRELQASLSGPLVGCTTSGELSTTGYTEHSIVGASISSAELRIHPRLITPLTRFGLPESEDLVSSLQQELTLINSLTRDQSFGLLLVDGMSMLEEQVIASLYNAIGGVRIIGGSAGDDLKFEQTWVYADGEFISNAAVFALFETTLPFMIFRTQHFQPSDKRLVITASDPPHRVVSEINGEPAAAEYARLVGLTCDELTPMVFSKHPVMLKIGGEHFVRSIQKVNEDRSLSFYCAIDNGLVLTVAEGVDLVKNLHAQLDAITSAMPNPQLIIGFDCILRRLEIMEKSLAADVEHEFAGHNIIGFSTYGEQFNAVHVNQTLTGVAIGG